MFLPISITTHGVRVKIESASRLTALDPEYIDLETELLGTYGHRGLLEKPDLHIDWLDTSFSNANTFIQDQHKQEIVAFLGALLNATKFNSVFVSASSGLELDCPFPLEVINLILSRTEHLEISNTFLLGPAMAMTTESCCRRLTLRSCYLKQHQNGGWVWVNDEPKANDLALLSTLYPIFHSVETLQLLQIQVGGFSCDHWRKVLMGPSLKRLKVLCHDINAEELFMALRTTPSNLKALEISINPKMADCRALAQYLRQPKCCHEETVGHWSPVQELKLASFGFCNDQGEEASEKETEAMVVVIAKGLQYNQSLLSFELSEDEAWAGQNTNMERQLIINHHCAKIFEQALRHNTFLTWFGVTYVDPYSDPVSNINLQLRLNRAGLAELIHGDEPSASKGRWIEMMAYFSDDLNCLFSLLKRNPTLATKTSDFSNLHCDRNEWVVL